MRARVKSQSIAIYDSAPSPSAAIRNDSIYNYAKTKATLCERLLDLTAGCGYRFPIQHKDVQDPRHGLNPDGWTISDADVS